MLNVDAAGLAKRHRYPWQLSAMAENKGMATKGGHLRRVKTQHVIIVFIKTLNNDSTVIKMEFVAKLNIL